MKSYVSSSRFVRPRRASAAGPVTAQRCDQHTNQPEPTIQENRKEKENEGEKGVSRGAVDIEDFVNDLELEQIYGTKQQSKWDGGLRKQEEMEHALMQGKLSGDAANTIAKAVASQSSSMSPIEPTAALLKLGQSDPVFSLSKEAVSFFVWALSLLVFLKISAMLRAGLLS